jgi:DNA-directed RNA polymerase specialized sigma24 family protein
LSEQSGDDHSEYSADLYRLGGPEGRAREAFDRLVVVSRPALLNFLRRYGLSEDAREDVAQAAFRNIWASRMSFEPNGLGAWTAYVRTVGARCAIDHLRRAGRISETNIDALPEIPKADLPYLDVLIDLAMRKRFYDVADACWLGKPAIDQDRRLLAAQLYYLHGMEPDAIAALLGDGACNLDDWLEDTPTLRRMAYGEFYRTNDELAGIVLSPDAPLTREELENVSRQAFEMHDEEPPGGWTWPEVRIVLWRIRNGLMTEQIVRFRQCEVSEEELPKLYARCKRRFPFVAAAKRLLETVDERTRTAMFKRADVWKRVAFQYHCAHELPQKQIHERTTDAADVTGYSLTEGVLAGWISVGRLFIALTNYVQEEELR